MVEREEMKSSIASQKKREKTERWHEEKAISCDFCHSSRQGFFFMTVKKVPVEGEKGRVAYCQRLVCSSCVRERYF